MLRLLRAVTVLALLATALNAGCDVCGLIDQEIIIDAADPELAPLLDDCRKGVAPTNEPLCAATARPNPQLECACLPVCDRVYGIVETDPHRLPLRRCFVSFDAAGQARIAIEYRSVCQ